MISVGGKKVAVSDSVGGKKVDVGDTVSFMLQAESINPKNIALTNFRKSLQERFLFTIFLCFSAKRLTVCVTRAGAGGGMPSDWRNAEA